VLAAVTADAELMKTFAELGADPLATNDEGSTALMAAAGLGTRSPGEDAGTEDEVIEAMAVAFLWVRISTRWTSAARRPCTAPRTKTFRWL
jgi:hypothetical protein